jgi:hypothetical protein
MLERLEDDSGELLLNAPPHTVQAEPGMLFSEGIYVSEGSSILP